MSRGLVQNFPLRLHALTCACTWFVFAMFNATYCYKHGGSLPGMLVSSLTTQLVIGVAIPVLVARFRTRSLWARYHALQVRPTTWQHVKQSGKSRLSLWQHCAADGMHVASVQGQACSCVAVVMELCECHTSEQQ